MTSPSPESTARTVPTTGGPPSSAGPAGTDDHTGSSGSAVDEARPAVRLRSAGDLVASVPYLVGFVPDSSAVVVSLRGPRRRAGVVARVDLPEAADVGEGQDSVWTSGLVSAVLRDDPREVLVLVYADEPWSGAAPPRQALVESLGAAFSREGVPVREALYVARDRFWSYTCTVPECCPVEGTALEPGRASEAAAAYVMEGRAPLDGRDALVRMVSPDAGHVAEVAAAADALLDDAVPRWRDGGEAAWRTWQEDSVRQFDALAGVALAHEPGGRPPVLPTCQVARVLAGLLDRTTRDLVAVRWTRWPDALGQPEAVAPAEGELSDLARRCPRSPADVLDPADLPDQMTGFLTALVARADTDLALAPLVLLAMHAWAGGEGALAAVAVDRALGIDPDYRMAVLLDQLLRAGIAPAWVAATRAGDEQAGG